MQARDAAVEVKKLPQRHRLVSWFVGCVEDSHRFSNISAITRLGSRR